MTTTIDAPKVRAPETPEEIPAEENGAKKKKSFKEKRAARREQKRLDGAFESYPHLLALKPKERYVFRSDYFEVDGSVATILAFFHDDVSGDGFAPFWGIDRIPDGLDQRVTAVVLEQVHRRDDAWVDNALKQSERLDIMDANEQAETGTTSSKRRARKISGDLEVTISELQDNASYLSVHDRLFLKAPDLEILEDSVDRVARLYIDRFGTLSAAPYAGEQRQELAGLWAFNDKKKGKGFHFTSTEFAGSYSLVTNGLNDPGGEYVGYMVGDVNNSAVLMDVNAYKHHVVVADGTFSEVMARQRQSDMWCSKLSQSAMLSNASVVHLVLDGADLDKLGPRFDRLTARVDLNAGDVNMFEMFGGVEDEMAVFATQMEKLKLMFAQLHESTDGSVASIIDSQLEELATDFYVDRGMWRRNAKENRRYLRVVGIPHDQVPLLHVFVSYLDTAHKGLINSTKNDPDQLRALNVLKGIANTMLSTNGDLFDNPTSSAIDGVNDARRVVYDFSRLMRRGKGVAMAQLVNVVGFAVGTLGLGDTVVIHGAETIDDRVKDYISRQFEHLAERGGRVVYAYNDVDKMLADSRFNHFEKADYTLLGPMTDRTVEEYQRQLAKAIPPDLASLVAHPDTNYSYLRRGVTNIVFWTDLALGTNPDREAQRRRVVQEAEKAEKEAQMKRLREKERPTKGARLTSAAPVVTEPRRTKDVNTAPVAKKAVPGRRAKAAGTTGRVESR